MHVYGYVWYMHISTSPWKTRPMFLALLNRKFVRATLCLLVLLCFAVHVYISILHFIVIRQHAHGTRARIWPHSCVCCAPPLAAAVQRNVRPYFYSASSSHQFTADMYTHILYIQSAAPHSFYTPHYDTVFSLSIHVHMTHALHEHKYLRMGERTRACLRAHCTKETVE